VTVIADRETYASLRRRGLAHADAVEVLRFRRFLQVVGQAPARGGARVLSQRWFDYCYPPGHPYREQALAESRST
jgi:hypothetical protein